MQQRKTAMRLACVCVITFTFTFHFVSFYFIEVMRGGYLFFFTCLFCLNRKWILVSLVCLFVVVCLSFWWKKNTHKPKSTRTTTTTTDEENVDEHTQHRKSLKNKTIKIETQLNFLSVYGRFRVVVKAKNPSL